LEIKSGLSKKPGNGNIQQQYFSGLLSAPESITQQPANLSVFTECHRIQPDTFAIDGEVICSRRNTGRNAVAHQHFATGMAGDDFPVHP
jgi:hypothetical protein